jgi:DNA-binding response OmpR family regulator
MIRMGSQILIVEDDASLRQAIAEYLARQGFRVDCASEREEAEALITFVEYQLIITDLSLTPFGLDGFGVMDFTWNRSPRPKVVVLTGCSEPTLECESQFRGVDVYLKKPQPLRKVSDIVHDLIGSGAAV